MFQTTFVYEVHAGEIENGYVVDGLKLAIENSFELYQGDDFIDCAKKVFHRSGKICTAAAVNHTYDQFGRMCESELVDTVTFEAHS